MGHFRIGKRKQEILDAVDLAGELPIDDAIALDGRNERRRTADRITQLVRNHKLLEYVRDSDGALVAVRPVEPRTARCPHCGKELV